MGWGSLARRGVIILVCIFTLAATSFAQDEPRGTIHIVQRGDTLFRIAQQYGVTTTAIAAANGIANPSNILVGQRLLIPLDAVTPLEPETYVVQYADTLQSIANVFGTDVATLVALNGLTDPDSIFYGQTLIIRGEVPPPPLDDAAETAGGSPQPVASNIVHRIQRGETLFRIAQQYGVSMADIQALNDIPDASRIITGTDLIIPAGGEDGITSASALPPAIVSLDLTPRVLTEGKTGRIRITTANPATVTIQFLDKPVAVSTADNVSHLAFAAIPLGTPVGIYALSITVTEFSGAVTPLTFNVQVNSGRYGTQYVTLPSNKVELLAPAVEQNEMAILQRVTAPVTSERYFAGPMGLPAAAPMFSEYGATRAFNGQGLTHYHTGADFAGAPGTPVIAASAGRVVLADTLNIRGIAVVIDHGWGVYTVYGHMSDRYVSIGDFVQAGQAIGIIGSTGRATGAHLHWEVWVNQIAVDPMQWALEAFP